MKLTVDTNVILRFLLADDIKQANSARKLLRDATLIAIPIPVWCEVVWNLSRGYKLNSEEIVEAISALLEFDGLQVNREAVSKGLAVLRAGGDFADGAIAQEGCSMGGEVFATFDKKAAEIIKKQTSITTRLLT